MFAWVSGVSKRFRKIDDVNPNLPGWPSYWLGIKSTGRFWSNIDKRYWSLRTIYYRYKRWQDMRHYHHPDLEVRRKYAEKVVAKATRLTIGRQGKKK